MRPDGLLVDIVVGMDAAGMVILQASGQKVPAPLQIVGVIDTGTDMTAIASHELRALGLTYFAHSSTHTSGGTYPVDLYKVSLTISPPGGTSGPTLVESDLTVHEMAHRVPGVDALIGLNVLSNCLLIVDGPGQYLTLSF